MLFFRHYVPRSKMLPPFGVEWSAGATPSEKPNGRRRSRIARGTTKVCPATRGRSSIPHRRRTRPVHLRGCGGLRFVRGQPKRRTRSCRLLARGGAFPCRIAGVEPACARLVQLLSRRHPDRVWSVRRGLSGGERVDAGRHRPRADGRRARRARRTNAGRRARRCGAFRAVRHNHRHHGDQRECARARAMADVPGGHGRACPACRAPAAFSGRPLLR